MNEADKKTKKRIRRVLKKWLRPLGLLWWNVKISYVDTLGIGDRGSEVGARTYVDWRYAMAHIEFSLSTCRSVSDSDLDTMVLHELVHILVNEMQGDDSDHDHEERVVTTLAKAFQWVRDGC